MKKLLFLGLALLGIGLAFKAHASLYSYYNGHLPSIQARISQATQCGISNYTGSAKQNVNLEACLRGTPQKGKFLGDAVSPGVPLFETSLQAPIDTVATSMTLVNGTDRGGTVLQGFVCLTIDSGTPQVEYVCGTANGTAISGMTRGVYITTTTTVSLPSLIFSHRRGADVRITDYPTLQIIANILNGTTPTKGLLTFSTTSITGLSTPLSSATTSAANVDYVNNTAVAGAPNAATNVKGIVQIATSSQLQASTGVGSTGAFLVPNGNAFNQTSSPNKVPVSNGNGKLDSSWGGVTSSLATLNASSTVVQNPASAVIKGATSSIPITSSTASTIDNSWINTGTGANQIPVLNGSGQFASIDASNLTGIPRLLSATTTAVAISNNAGEIAIVASTTVPANFLSATGTIHIHVKLSNGDLINARSLTFKLKYGNSTIVSAGSSNGTGGTVGFGTGDLDCTLLEAQATNAQAGECVVWIGNDGVFNGVAGTNQQPLFKASGTGTSAVDDTQLQILTVTATFSVADMNNTITADSSYVELIR